MRKYIVFLLLFSGMLSVSAQAPNGSGTYYADAHGKKGEALKTAFYNIDHKSGNHTVLDYGSLEDYYPQTDKKANNIVRDWYGNYDYTFSQQISSGKEGEGWNKEHLIPQSWFKGNAGSMKSDIIHVVPADANINGKRGNIPLAEVGTVTDTDIKSNFCKKGTSKVSGFTGTCFEPDNSVKGDIARIYFYVLTCYEDKISSWASNAQASNVFDGKKYPGMKKWALDMFMRWSKQDPVDNVEIARNQAVSKCQKNRNPFVDYPGLEEYIWGDSVDVAFNYSNYKQPVTDIPDDPDDPDDPDNPIVIDGESLFCETFDGCTGTGGNDGQWSGAIADGSVVCDLEGWNLGAYSGGGNKCARFGSGSKKGSATTPAITIDGDCVLRFKAAPWGTDNCSINLSVSNSDIQLEASSFGPMTKNGWNEYTTTISGSGTFTLTFTPTSNRFFLDQVDILMVEPETATAISTTNKKTKGEEVYDMNGVRVSHKGSTRIPKRDVYIIGGKKFFNR